MHRKIKEAPRTIYFQNLDFKATRKEVNEFFQQFGTLKRTIILYDCGRKTGGGFIVFNDESSAKELLSRPPRNLIIGNKKILISATKSIVSTDDDKCPINDLFPELLVHIFSFLPIKDRLILEKVCKKWHDVVQILWKSKNTLTLEDLQNALPYVHRNRNTGFVQFIRRLTNLRKIDLRCGYSSKYTDKQLTNGLIRAIADNCPKLEEFYVPSMEFRRPCFRPIAKNFPNLEKIEIPEQMLEREVWWIFKLCQNLKYFTASHNLNIKGHFLYMINPKMVSIKLEQCGRLLTITLINMMQKCNNLQTLKLTGHRGVTTNFLEHLVNDCKDMRNLCLDDCGDLLLCVKPLANLENLEHLSLARIACVDDNFITQISQSCKNLKTLNLTRTNISNRSLENLKQLLHLSNLNISQTHVTNAGIKHLAKCRKLSELYMIGCNPHIEDGIKDIIMRCVNLRILDLCDNKLNFTSIVQFAFEKISIRKSPLTIYVELCTYPEIVTIPRLAELTIVKKVMCGECTRDDYRLDSLDLDDDDHDYYDSEYSEDFYSELEGWPGDDAYYDPIF